MWGNTNIPKLWVSYIFHVKQKSIQFLNRGMSKFPYCGASMGKHRQFPGSALPQRCWVNENSCNPNFQRMYKFPWHGNILWKTISFSGCGFWRNMGIFFSQFMEHRWESFPFMYWEWFFSCESKTFPKTWEEQIPIVGKNMGKHQHLKIKCF